MQKTNNPHGYWKFSNNRVSLQELESFAQELAKDDRFVSIHIRKVSKDQHGIGFIANIDTSAMTDFFNFHDEFEDMIKRRFGNGLVGWDIAEWYIPIK